MTSNRFFRLASLAGAALAIAPATQAFDTKWHADATRIAMQQNGFSADARLLCQFTNYITDFFSVVGFEPVYHLLPDGPPPGAPTGVMGINMEDMARLHFDALTTHAQVESQWDNLFMNTKQALTKWSGMTTVKPAFKPVVLMTIVGASLHAVQDFYSHSNWVRKAKAVGGATPIWFDVPADQRKKLEIKSGWYPDGNKPDMLYHKDENKDSTGRPLNAEAYDAASRASSDWVRRLIAATPNLNWASLRNWKAEPANMNGTWLRNADATFITTTSTLAGHWDGSTPVKNVFNPDKIRNRNMAVQALLLSLNVYKTNVGLSGPLTPTPHWVGFSMYHVEKDLAKGLFLQNKKR